MGVAFDCTVSPTGPRARIVTLNSISFGLTVISIWVLWGQSITMLVGYMDS